MKRIGISILVLVGVGGLIGLLSYRPKSATVGTAKTTSAQSTGVGQSRTATPAAGVAGQYKDGTYTGSTEDVGYGPVQVQAVVSGGKLTGVNFLQMPSDRQQSQQIASEAEPLLLQEAIQAQSSAIDTVSGATSDSEGFVQSLQSALDQAKA